jgi:magnesium transporter
LVRHGVIILHIAGEGGFGYLKEPMWWLGMISMVAGELANFAAYAFAAAIVVTPLGALSIIVSAVLSHKEADEKLNVLGFLGCGLCIVGSVVIVLHAPHEQGIRSVQEARFPCFSLDCLLCGANGL